MTTPPSTAILRALRAARDEVQLTQVLATVAGEDDEFAGALARALVEAAPNKPQCEAIEPVPERLRCRREASLKSVSGPSHGRVDLRFDDLDRTFTLLAELKLHSPYGHDQVRRYSEALAELPQDGRRRGLLAITRNVPGVGEPGADEPTWLGSLRWAAIYETLLRLPVADPDLQVQWRLFLEVVNEQGDFGVRKLERERVEGWSAYLETRERLEALVEDLASPALEHLQQLLVRREAWAGTPDAQTATLHTRGVQKKVPYPTQQTVQARFILPSADAHERLRIQFLGGFAEPLFTVEARRAGAPLLLAGRAKGHQKFIAAVNLLMRTEPPFVTDERVYFARVHGAREWLTLDDERSVGEALLDIIKIDFGALAESGILDPDSGFDADRGLVLDEEAPADEA